MSPQTDQTSDCDCSESDLSFNSGTHEHLSGCWNESRAGVPHLRVKRTLGTGSVVIYLQAHL